MHYKLPDVLTLQPASVQPCRPQHISDVGRVHTFAFTLIPPGIQVQRVLPGPDRPPGDTEVLLGEGRSPRLRHPSLPRRPSLRRHRLQGIRITSNRARRDAHFSVWCILPYIEDARA